MSATVQQSFQLSDPKHLSPSPSSPPDLISPSNSSHFSDSSPETPHKFSASRQDFSARKQHGSHHSLDGSVDLSAQQKHRACDRCRQQKQKCNVQIGPPYVVCTRCQTGNMAGDCKISDGFQRIGKRKRNMEVEEELSNANARIAELQQQADELRVAFQAAQEQLRDRVKRGSVPSALIPSTNTAYFKTPISPRRSSTTTLTTCDQSRDMETSLAANAMMTLSSFSPRIRPAFQCATPPIRRTPAPKPKTWYLPNLNPPIALADIPLLINEFMDHYHQYLPILCPGRSATDYNSDSELLFWVIISVASRRWAKDPTLKERIQDPLKDLLFRTLRGVSQNHHDVKALCIICTWPLTVESTSNDPTYTICGAMMQIAYQIGLHRPTHRQDFSRSKAQAQSDDLEDRIKTWAACNIVAQTVSTGYGLPSNTLYDYTLDPSNLSSLNLTLPRELQERIAMEELSDEITRAFYCTYPERSRLIPAERREHHVHQLREKCRQSLDDLRLFDAGHSAVNYISLLTLEVHLALAQYHAYRTGTPDHYRDAIWNLYFKTKQFLVATVRPIDGRSWADWGMMQSSDRENVIPDLLRHCPFYIYQMLLVSAFVIWKISTTLPSSDLSDCLQINDSELLALQDATLKAVRDCSVKENDLPDRFERVLEEMYEYKASYAGQFDSDIIDYELRVRCRASMSLVHDTVWKWRNAVQAQGKSHLLEGGKVKSEDGQVLAPEAGRLLIHRTSIEKLEQIANQAATPPSGVGDLNETIKVEALTDGSHLLGPSGHQSPNLQVNGFPHVEHSNLEGTPMPEIDPRVVQDSTGNQTLLSTPLVWDLTADPAGNLIFDPVSTLFDEFDGNLSTWMGRDWL